MVGVALSFLTTLTPKISALGDIKKLLVYLVRSCALHQPHKPLLSALNKTLVYRVTAKVRTWSEVEMGLWGENVWYIYTRYRYTRYRSLNQI